MGLVAAVEQWRVRDHAAEWAEWERRIVVVEAAAIAAGPPGRVHSSRYVPGKSNVAPMVDIRWAAGGGLCSPDEVRPNFGATKKCR